MLAKDILLPFLEYNHRANGHVLEKVKQLSVEQLHGATQMSHGNAFDLVRHMLDTEWSWRLFASGGAGQKYLWEVEDVPDIPAMERFWQAEHERLLEFARSLSDADLAREVDYGTAQGGPPHFMQLWQILIHVVNHGTHHRSELSRMLEDSGHPIAQQDLDFASFATRRG
jgi:uncharacterized damage-inducible protein DinB